MYLYRRHDGEQKRQGGGQRVVGNAVRLHLHGCHLTEPTV